MSFQNFHDGYFDGVRLEPDKTAHIFLRTAKKQGFVLVLRDVEALTVSGVKAGNIILDLVCRSASEATIQDIHELYDVDENSEREIKLLKSTQEKKFQILELNPSYGAQGVFLFQNYEMKEGDE